MPGYPINSRVDALSVIGNFPVQNTKEGKYWIAALHFLRSVSKMFYGPGGNQGNPPQILHLNGYGQHIFKDVPVVVEQVTVELRESVDYIAVETPPNQDVTRVPTDSVFTVLVQPVYSRKRIKDKFNLKDFTSGKLADHGFI